MRKFIKAEVKNVIMSAVKEKAIESMGEDSYPYCYGFFVAFTIDFISRLPDVHKKEFLKQLNELETDGNGKH